MVVIGQNPKIENKTYCEKVSNVTICTDVVISKDTDVLSLIVWVHRKIRIMK